MALHRQVEEPSDFRCLLALANDNDHFVIPSDARSRREKEGKFNGTAERRRSQVNERTRGHEAIHIAHMYVRAREILVRITWYPSTGIIAPWKTRAEC